MVITVSRVVIVKLKDGESIIYVVDALASVGTTYSNLYIEDVEGEIKKYKLSEVDSVYFVQLDIKEFNQLDRVLVSDSNSLLIYSSENKRGILQNIYFEDSHMASVYDDLPERVNKAYSKGLSEDIGNDNYGYDDDDDDYDIDDDDYDDYDIDDDDDCINIVDCIPDNDTKVEDDLTVLVELDDEDAYDEDDDF